MMEGGMLNQRKNTVFAKEACIGDDTSSSGDEANKIVRIKTSIPKAEEKNGLK